MFSLIIVLVSIGLAAAIALATLYYGGDAFREGETAARAARVVNQGQQVLGAADMFKSEQGRWPNSMAEMVALKYLKEIPTVPALTDGAGAGGGTQAPPPPEEERPLSFMPGLVSDAVAASSEVAWTMPMPGNPTFVLESAVNTELCQEVNRKVRGDNGILKRARTTLTAQCFGDAASSLTVVVTRNPAQLVGPLAEPKVKTASIPSDGASPDWFVSPGSEVSGGAPAGAGGGAATGTFVATRYYGATLERLGWTELGEAIMGIPFFVEQTGANVAWYSNPQNQNNWDYVLVTNTSTEPALFDFYSGENMGGMAWYSNGGTPEEERAIQKAEWGHHFCEEGGTLQPGEGCLIEGYVPDSCSRKYSESQGPLTFNMGPTSCPSVVSGVDIQEYKFGDPDAQFTVKLSNMGDDNEWYVEGGAEILSKTTDTNGVTTVRLRITPTVYADDRYFNVYHSRGGSMPLGEVTTSCGDMMVKQNGTLPGYGFSGPICTPDYAGADGFFVDADPASGWFGYPYPSFSYVNYSTESVPEGHSGVWGASMETYYGAGFYTTFIYGKGSDSFSAKMYQALVNKTMVMTVDGVTSDYHNCTNNSGYTVCQISGWREGAGGNAHSYYVDFYFQQGGGSLLGLRVRVQDYENLDTNPAHLLHVSSGKLFRFSATGGAVDMEFGLRSDGTFLKQWRYGQFIPKEMKLGTGMYRGHTFNIPTY